MYNKLIKLADDLDSKGLKEEADVIDEVLQSINNEEFSSIGRALLQLLEPEKRMAFRDFGDQAFLEYLFNLIEKFLQRGGDKEDLISKVHRTTGIAVDKIKALIKKLGL